MNLESSSSETLISMTSDLPLANSSQVPTPVALPYIESPANGSDQDYEEFALAKAPTLMPGDDVDQPFDLEPQSPFARTRYVQGIIMGQRACIVTNLCGVTSQMLFQPQMVWTIGRNREAALPLRDRLLSRRHAVILYLPDEGFHVIDLNSMNGSFLNGVRIQQRQPLNDGDVLRMGNIEFSFFTSANSRSIEPIHPEVLARFINPATRSGQFIDYSALEEPEILFNALRED